MHRLLLALVLSQALACQALVASWSGALAAAGPHVAGTICSGALLDPDGDDGGPSPATPNNHRDCLGVCTAACHAANLPGQFLVLAPSDVLVAIQPPHIVELLERTEAPGFLARAPPVTT